MSEFTVRIELHGAAQDDYEILHGRMEAAGFSRSLVGVDDSGNPGVWHLPTAEYNYSAELSATAVRVRAKGIADGVKPGAWCLVSQVSHRSWSTKKVA